MFVQILNQVAEQTSRQCQGSNTNTVNDYLLCAIRNWCSKLDISEDESNYIQRGYKQQEILNFLFYLYQEGRTEKKTIKIQTPWGEQGFSVENQFNQHIKVLFFQMNITMSSVKIIVLIAFVVTAVGYFFYKLNQLKKQQISRREELIQYNSNPPSFTVQAPTEKEPPVQRITKHFLVLVISASQADFLGLLKEKKHIDLSDGEALYEITRYLWLGSENEYSQKIANVNQYSVSQGEESEYNVYLVSIELKQADEGFKPNINQLDRYDAFRKLADLAVDVKVSDRLRIESYEKIEVYNR